MKKYIISILIPCLLIYLTGCYSMQEVTKEEFSPAPDYPKLIVNTDKKEITFNQGHYFLMDETIYGIGNCVNINNVEERFDSSLGLGDIDKIQIEKFNTGETIALASTIVVVIVGFLALALYSTWSLDGSWGK